MPNVLRREASCRALERLIGLAAVEKLSMRFAITARTPGMLCSAPCLTRLSSGRESRRRLSGPAHRPLFGRDSRPSKTALRFLKQVGNLVCVS